MHFKGIWSRLVKFGKVHTFFLLIFQQKMWTEKKSYKPLHYVVNTCVSIQLLESDRLDIDSRSWNASHLT